VSAWVACLWERKGQGIVLRLARGREEGLLAGVADDAHGSLVLWGDVRLDHGAPRCQRFSLGRAVPSSTATRPWCRPSCRSGRASAPPWLPVKAVSRSRSDGILRPARFGISVAGDSGTSTAGDRGHTLPPPILMYESFLAGFLVSSYSRWLWQMRCDGTQAGVLLRLYFSFLPAAKSGAPEEVVWRSPPCDGATGLPRGLGSGAKCGGHGPERGPFTCSAPPRARPAGVRERRTALKG
jgi:hypothetical protein